MEYRLINELMELRCKMCKNFDPFLERFVSVAEINMRRYLSYEEDNKKPPFTLVYKTTTTDMFGYEGQNVLVFDVCYENNPIGEYCIHQIYLFADPEWEEIQYFIMHGMLKIVIRYLFPELRNYKTQ